MLLRRIDSMHANGAAGWRFTFVDDGSSDDTFTTLLNASKSRDWISVVRHASHLGFGAAVKTGFASSGSPVLCSMGCSDPPAVLEELKKLVDDDADIAVATTARRSAETPSLALPGDMDDRDAMSSDPETLLSRIRVYRRETLERFGLRGSGPLSLARVILRALTADRTVRVVRMASAGDGSASLRTGAFDTMRLRMAMFRARTARKMTRWTRRGADAQDGTAGDSVRADPHRVLIIIENLPYPFDRRMFQEATTLRRAGYEVSVICPIGKGCESRYEDVDGVNVYRYPLHVEGDGILGYVVEYGASLLWQYALAWKVFFKHGFDVIHAANPPDNIFAIALAFRPFGKKFVFDHHDINPELYEAKFGKRSGLPYKLICLLERLSFRCADVSIATNESYKEIAIERGGMAPEDVYVVRSGPDLDRMKITRPSPGLRHGRKHLVGYVGVMGRQEGIDYLLRAARHMIHEMGRTDVHFGLVGGGTELESMKQYAEDLGLADHVTFTGRVPDPDMLEMLNTADVCVNPDVANAMNDKSTMNKIMEYMALAKPIVQFDLREGRVSAGPASLYAAHNDEVDFAEKIVTLLDDPALRLRMGDLGRKRVETRLAWKYEAPKLLDAYAAVFGEEAGKGARRAKRKTPAAVGNAATPVPVAMIRPGGSPIAEPSAHAVAPVDLQ